jgi:hypothetical protein
MIMIRCFSVIFTFAVLFFLNGSAAFPISKDETAYLATIKCNIKIWETIQKDCEKKVQYRKNGRWVYEMKKVKCPETVETAKSMILTDVVVAKNPREAKEKLLKQYKSRELLNVVITSVKPVQ